MGLPTVNDVQFVETVLTNLAVSYMQADIRFVASRAFPVVPVPFDSGTYPTFPKAYWFTDAMQPRAPGAEFAAGGFGVSSGTYVTLQYALEVAIADEQRANSQLPMDLEQAATAYLAQKSLIRKEMAFATDFMTTSVWGTDGSVTAKFSTYDTSDPVKDISDTACRTISTATGQIANTAVMGEIVHARLRNHPDVMARVQYVQIATQANIDGAIAAVFGIPNWLVGRASYNSVNEAQTASMAAIIDDDILICYVAPGATMWMPSAGYTFVWPGGGGQGTIYNVRSDLRHADIIQINEQWDQVKVASDCGYFFADCTD